VAIFSLLSCLFIGKTCAQESVLIEKLATFSQEKTVTNKQTVFPFLLGKVSYRQYLGHIYTYKIFADIALQSAYKVRINYTKKKKDQEKFLIKIFPLAFKKENICQQIIKKYAPYRAKIECDPILVVKLGGKSLHKKQLLFSGKKSLEVFSEMTTRLAYNSQCGIMKTITLVLSFTFLKQERAYLFFSTQKYDSGPFKMTLAFSFCLYL